MTPLPPGPELDKLVAEVMGGTPLPLGCWDIGGVGYRRWQPSTSREQACGPVLDWLRGQMQGRYGGLYVGMHDDGPDKGTEVRGYVHAHWSGPRLLGKGDTLEHALCLAVLAVREMTMPTDADLARRTCALLSLSFVGCGPDRVYVSGPGGGMGGGLHTTYSWPDLSAAALRQVAAKGWWLFEAATCGDEMVVVELDADWKPRPRPKAREADLFKALCAAACQTQDALG